jgi:hypothetical protein
VTFCLFGFTPFALSHSLSTVVGSIWVEGGSPLRRGCGGRKPPPFGMVSGSDFGFSSMARPSWICVGLAPGERGASRAEAREQIHSLLRGALGKVGHVSVDVERDAWGVDEIAVDAMLHLALSQGLAECVERALLHHK